MADDARCEEMRVERARLNKLADDMPGKLPPPVADFEDQVAPHERAMIEEALSCSAVGAPDTIEREIAAFVEHTGADEVMITANIHDHAKRLRSFELVAGMMGSTTELQRRAAP